MKKIAFMTPPDAEFGFGLAGVPQYAVEKADAEVMLEKILQEPDTGLLIIDERLFEAIPEERLRALEPGWDGILLALPSPGRPPAEVEDYAAQLIRRTIGYHVRLKV